VAELIRRKWVFVAQKSPRHVLNLLLDPELLPGQFQSSSFVTLACSTMEFCESLVNVCGILERLIRDMVHYS
jgi:hypothetical protein